ncbi:MULTISPECIES: hypothetical protein [Methylobacterium]|jgi:hypothetical protein|uniref:hypothetical protein n=1 Tax=Methylobacterium TaxID=407 RepID=UPI0011C9841E|nr:MULTISPECIES: hypothetical protein [Methylobacterium]TXN41777.1 hypothetical protein FV233_24625 [Methylobacterium sp. WL7]GJE20788.1 hypothetical protein JHFBIEKO_1221 [Methylobacterium mesophilicum]
MAILSRDFGGVKLSGRDAETFLRQVASSEKQQVVLASLERGRKLQRSMTETGKVAVDAGNDAGGK